MRRRHAQPDPRGRSRDRGGHQTEKTLEKLPRGLAQFHGGPIRRESRILRDAYGRAAPATAKAPPLNMTRIGWPAQHALRWSQP